MRESTTRGETRCYISRIKKVRAPEILGYIRSHWAIENGCHWVLDAIYREDPNQTRDRAAATNFATLRCIALNTHNLVRPQGDNAKRPESLPKRELRATLDPTYLEKLLSLV